jgi:hypothetical protein
MKKKKIFIILFLFQSITFAIHNNINLEEWNDNENKTLNPKPKEEFVRLWKKVLVHNVTFAFDNAS